MVASPSVAPIAHQAEVNDYFDSESTYWQDLYVREPGVVGEIIRDRHNAVLKWVASLDLAPGSRVLEVGCGAGYLATELAHWGLDVSAIDSSQAMVDRALQNGADVVKDGHLRVSLGDAHELSFEDGAFDLVIAIGVIAWIDSPERAVTEMSRVTRVGGSVILTSANLMELRSFFDPWRLPPFRPLKLRLKTSLESCGVCRPTPSMTFHSTHSVDRMIAGAGLTKIRASSVGFGPFSLMGRGILPAKLAIPVHRRLQGLADRDVPFVKNGGMSYLIHGRKPAPKALPHTAIHGGEPLSTRLNTGGPT
jgi:ubiquinone/menaquinone biosynthesis C-methylase UbiE